MTITTIQYPKGKSEPKKVAKIFLCGPSPKSNLDPLCWLFQGSLCTISKCLYHKLIAHDRVYAAWHLTVYTMSVFVYSSFFGINSSHIGHYLCCSFPPMNIMCVLSVWLNVHGNLSAHQSSDPETEFRSEMLQKFLAIPVRFINRTLRNIYNRKLVCTITIE